MLVMGGNPLRQPHMQLSLVRLGVFLFHYALAANSGKNCSWAYKQPRNANKCIYLSYQHHLIVVTSSPLIKNIIAEICQVSPRLGIGQHHSERENLQVTLGRINFTRQEAPHI